MTNEPFARLKQALDATPSVEGVPIANRIADLERKFKDLCNKSERQRNRAAIELHGKLDQLIGEVEHDPNVTQRDKDRLNVIMDGIMRDVFGITS